MASTTMNPFSTTTDSTPTTVAPRKEYNINRPTPFTGDRAKIENFVQECDVYLNINDTIYDTDAAKIAFVLSFITAGEAQKWKEQFIRSITSNSRMTFPTFAIFMAKLQDAFKAVNPVDSAMQKLALLRQGNRPVEELITDFRLLVGDARLSTDSDSDQIHLIKMFMICLNPQLKKKIIFGEKIPKTIEEWYNKAIQFDSNYRLAQALQSLDNSTPKKKNWFNQNQNKDPNAMDTSIGALTEEMKTALMKIGACFRCRKTGHLSRDCPDKNKGNTSTSAPAQAPKKFTPKDVHGNIRNMTKEERAELMALMMADKEDF